MATPSSLPIPPAMPRASEALRPFSAGRMRLGGGSSSGLSKNQLRAVVAFIAAAHIGGGWALLQIPQVREAVLESAPIFVNFIAPPAPPAPAPPPPPVPTPPRAITKAPPPRIITAAPSPSPAPAPFVAPPPPEVVPAPAPPAPPVVAAPAPPAPAPAAPAEPVMIPESALSYLTPPVVVYPAAARRLRETGVTVLRLAVDDTGVPTSVTVSKSSGFSRLDEAAIATYKKIRLKPQVVNGRRVAVVANATVNFDMED